MDSLKFSLCLICYNQEKFIRTAVENALGQTYSNLEIVISDDCSTDRTFEIIQSIVKTYRGSHEIILNRNKKNLGISGNRNVAWSLATGDWIVSQDCDDISLRERVDILNKVIGDNKNLSYVSTAISCINEHGAIIGNAPFDFSPNAVYQLSGCCTAYRRDIIDVFGPIGAGCLDDVCFLFRSILLGDLLLVDTPTVLKREHDDPFVYMKKDLTYWQWFEDSFLQMKKDLEIVRKQIDIQLASFLDQQLLYKLHPKFPDEFNNIFENKKKVLYLYAPETCCFLKIKMLLNWDIPVIKKIKLFLLSFQKIRIQHSRKTKISTLATKEFSHKSKLITWHDVVTRTVNMPVLNYYK